MLEHALLVCNTSCQVSLCFGKFTCSNKKLFEWKSVPELESRKYFVRRWHGHSGIGFNLVREWYGRVGKFVSGMTIRE